MLTLTCTHCGQKTVTEEATTGDGKTCPACGHGLRAASGPTGSTPDTSQLSSPEAATLPPLSPSPSPDDSSTLPPAKPPAASAGAEWAGLLAAPQGPEEIGRLGPYRVLRVLGAGGMGVVFQAEDPKLRRFIALKAMLPSLAAAPASAQRFLREARAAAAIEHDHVVAVLHVGEERGVPYLAMPFLKGESLDERLRRAGKLPLPELLRIGRETAEGLAAAHDAGLVHRDIKPGNIWLEGERGRVKILDFGLARVLGDDAALTQAGYVMGTPHYMAPEQANAQEVDARCDLFSLGCVLYQMATGKQPFAGANPLSVLMAVVGDEPPPPQQLEPSLPPGLCELIVRLMSKSPAGRPASAHEVVQALRGLEGQSFTSPLPAARRPPVRRSRRLIGLGLAAMLGLLGLGLAWKYAPALSRHSEPAPPDVSDPAASVPAPTYSGWVDVRVWSKGGQDRRRLGLADSGALPLRGGDRVRIEAQVQPAGYLYLLWIDSDGHVDPVYPWQPGKWGTRPTPEQPREGVSLPEKASQGWPLAAGAAGMETLLLLVHDRPLSVSDEQLQKLVSGLPPQRPVQNERAAVWFANGEVVRDEPHRGPSFFSAEEVDDPVLRVQQLLRDKLQPLVRYTRAVSFAREGS